ncbi:transporter, CPA2 family [Saccharopolyspora shandongensis]|uniref:Transporter, CPA2 family n=1 Tax=Saccharopolyspora shandongensis TaxID=418495 RepID=A0A1H3SQ70_9PSEU|nr:cation:proton antiporter [Saccharopolyspora shandongensis]SDZ39877.1 transporter, CPA2 family [Saccharopolyspora shandongensis]
MPEVSFANLFFVSLIALCTPTFLGFFPRVRIPSVVVAIAAGIVLGPSGLEVIQVDSPVQILALLGLAFLLFLAGLEIDMRRMRGHLARVALAGYGITLLISVLAGQVFSSLDWVRSPLLVAVALSATSLGLIVPVLIDADQMESRTGLQVIAASSVAEFGSVLLLSLLFSTSGGNIGERLVRLVVFAALVAAVGVAVSLADRSVRLGGVFLRLQDTTAELRVRAAVALLIGFVVLAQRIGLETILGAFVAGVLVGTIDRDTTTHPRFRTKLDAIGYGFLVPVFFITSGLQLDLHALFSSTSALLRVPVFLLALLIVRGVPAVLYLRVIGVWASVAAALLQATSLPLIVTAAQIGVVLGLLLPVNAAALVCAGLLSTLLFPAAALAVLRRRDLDSAARPRRSQ